MSALQAETENESMNVVINATWAMSGILTLCPSHTSLCCVIDRSAFYGQRWGWLLFFGGGGLTPVDNLDRGLVFLLKSFFVCTFYWKFSLFY